MPPPKKSKAKVVAAPDDRTPISTLLARCSRAELERLLEESVSAGTAVTYQQVVASLPEAKQAVVISRPVLKDGPAREGTGRFDDLDDHILIGIISQVSSTRTILACAIAVCKAWRGVLRSCTELFTELSVSASRYERLRTDEVRVTSNNFARLLTWLPDVAAVTKLTLDSGDKHASIAPDVVKRAMPMFKGLAHLSLSGKKTTAALLGVIAKQSFSSQLKTFELGYCAATAMDALPLLTRATRLESLKINLGWGTDGSFFRSLASTWRAARGGDAAPLLSRIATMGYAEIPLTVFTSLPSLFPELTEVTTTVRAHDITPAPDFDVTRLETFARLRTLSIGSLIRSFSSSHLSDAKLNNVLRVIFHMAPHLTSLKINHGQMYVSGRQAKEGKRMEPLPSPVGALAFLPASLTSLELGTMRLDPTEFDLTAGLASLRTLTLKECGPHTHALATSLADDSSRCPLLTRKTTFVNNRNSPRGSWLLGGLMCLDPVEQAKREAAAEAAVEKIHNGNGGTVFGAASTSASGGADPSEEGEGGADDPMEDDGAAVDAIHDDDERD
jgi:hypothetical protein